MNKTTQPMKPYLLKIYYLSLVFLFGITACSESKKEPKPNIILFLVDDMGWQDTSVPFWTKKNAAKR